MYHHAKSCVRSGNEISNFFSCNIGVRQGDNLCPLLFAMSIYLNDFEYHISRHYSGLQNISSQISNYLSNDDIEVFFRLFTLLYAEL